MSSSLQWSTRVGGGYTFGSHKVPDALEMEWRAERQAAVLNETIVAYVNACVAKRTDPLLHVVQAIQRHQRQPARLDTLSAACWRCPLVVPPADLSTDPLLDSGDGSCPFSAEKGRHSVKGSQGGGRRDDTAAAAAAGGGGGVLTLPWALMQDADVDALCESVLPRLTWVHCIHITSESAPGKQNTPTSGEGGSSPSWNGAGLAALAQCVATRCPHVRCLRVDGQHVVAAERQQRGQSTTTTSTSTSGTNTSLVSAMSTVASMLANSRFEATGAAATELKQQERGDVGLRVLALAACGLQDHAVVRLADALAERTTTLYRNVTTDLHVQHLSRLILPHNDIGVKGATALAKALTVSPRLPDIVGCRLVQLDLRHNRIGDEGATQLCNALLTLFERDALNVKAQQNHVHRSRLEEADPVAAATCRCFPLRELDLGGNGIGVAGAQSIANVLTHAHCSLMRLSLRSNPAIGDVGAWVLATALHRRRLAVPSLREESAAAAAAAAAAALADASSLSSSLSSRRWLRELYVGQCGISAHGAIFFVPSRRTAQNVTGLHALRTLDLQGASIVARTLPLEEASASASASAAAGSAMGKAWRQMLGKQIHEELYLDDVNAFYTVQWSTFLACGRGQWEELVIGLWPATNDTEYVGQRYTEERVARVMAKAMERNVVLSAWHHGHQVGGMAEWIPVQAVMDIARHVETNAMLRLLQSNASASSDGFTGQVTADLEQADAEAVMRKLRKRTAYAGGKTSEGRGLSALAASAIRTGEAARKWKKYRQPKGRGGGEGEDDEDEVFAWQAWLQSDGTRRDQSNVLTEEPDEHQVNFAPSAPDQDETDETEETSHETSDEEKEEEEEEEEEEGGGGGGNGQERGTGEERIARLEDIVEALQRRVQVVEEESAEKSRALEDMASVMDEWHERVETYGSMQEETVTQISEFVSRITRQVATVERYVQDKLHQFDVNQSPKDWVTNIDLYVSDLSHRIDNLEQALIHEQQTSLRTVEALLKS